MNICNPYSNSLDGVLINIRSGFVFCYFYFFFIKKGIYDVSVLLWNTLTCALLYLQLYWFILNSTVEFGLKGEGHHANVICEWML